MTPTKTLRQRERQLQSLLGTRRAGRNSRNWRIGIPQRVLVHERSLASPPLIASQADSSRGYLRFVRPAFAPTPQNAPL